MSHQCNNLIIHCMDFRFTKAIKDFMEDEGIMGDCDTVTIAGGVKSLIEPMSGEHHATLKDQIDLSKKLHGIKNIYFINHTDCGAYGGKAAFANSTEEKEKHYNHLQKSKDMILSMYPDMNIIKVLASIDDFGSIKLDKIS